MTTETNHAEQNAKAWLNSIKEMVAALECDYDRRDELRELKSALDRSAPLSDEELEELADLEADSTIDGYSADSADAVRDHIQESVLSVEARGDWYTPGEARDTFGAPSEYKITLTTGGPALRIIGELDQYAQPDSARLQYQDWGTPWTEHIVTGSDHDALLAFAQQFYFGE